DMVTTKKSSTPIAVSGISSTPEVTSLQKDQKIQITATVSPAQATNKTVSWSSSNSEIATVDKNGLVTAVGPGTATISAKTEEGNYTGQSSITVTANNPPLAENTPPTVPENDSNKPDLVGYWMMNEGSGNTLMDHSGNNNHATIQNTSGVSWVTGKNGLALSLTGTLNRFATVDHNPSLDINEEISISAWIKPIGKNRKQILSKGDPEGYEFSIFENGKVEFRFNRKSEGNNYMIQSIADYPTDGKTWMHVAITFDGTTSTLYINGKEDNSISYSPTRILSNTTELQIGAKNSINRWEGDLDEVRLYSRALSDFEIFEVFNGEVMVPKTPNPIFPDHGATELATAVLMLEWDETEFADAYQVQVADKSSFDNPIVNLDNATATQLEMKDLEEGTEYFWRVKAKNTNGDSDWSAAWQFQTITPVPEIIAVTEVKVEPETLSLDADTSSELACLVYPSNASSTKVIWTSSDNSIASVDENGLVTALGPGTATISAKTEEGNFTGQSSITVTANNPPLAENTPPTVPENDSNKPDLVGYWMMNEGSGNTLMDHSGNNNHATIQNTSGVSWVTGKNGLALSLTGTLNRFATVDHNPSLDINEEISISAWIKPIGKNRKQILSKGDPEGYEFSIFENGKVEFRFNRKSEGNNYMIQSIADYPTDGKTWMHVAITFDGTTSTLYINGKEDNSISYSPTRILSNTTELQIGAKNSINRWEGDLDEVRLYSRALSDFEIFEVFNGEVMVPKTPNPIFPDHGATELATAVLMLEWDETEFADAYQVQVADKSSFDNPIVNLDNATATQLEMKDLEEGTEYFWRVKAKNTNGDSDWSAAWQFQTITPVPEIIAVTEVKVEPETLSLDADTSSELACLVYPSNASSTKVIWTSSDNSIASVDENGLVTALGPGTATISAKTEEGGHASHSTVTVPGETKELLIEGFYLLDAAEDKVISGLIEGDQLDYDQIRDMALNFRANTFPEELGSVDISLEGPVNSSRSDNEFTYELLNNKGLLLPIGEYTLTATPYSFRENGGDKGTSLSIRFSIMDVNGAMPKTPQLTSPATGSTGLSKNLLLEWKDAELTNSYQVQLSDNDSFDHPVHNIENVQGTELEVNDMKEGTEYFWRVRALNDNGQSEWSSPMSFKTEDLSDEKNPNSGIHLTIFLKAGNTFGLSATITSAEESQNQVIWSSSDEHVLTISENGIVTAKNPGTATITAKTMDGGLTSTTTIIVEQDTSKFSVESFQMTNAASNSVIHKLSDGEVINIHQARDLDLNFRAITSSPEIKSVFISLTGPVNSSRTDNSVHYELLSNKGLNLPSGKYTLTAVPYSELDKGGVKGDSYTIHFTVSGEEPRMVLDSPDLISPSNGDKVDASALQLFWIDEANADQYEVHLSPYSDFMESDLVKSGLIKDNQFELLDRLEYGKEYHWRVRSRKDGEWSDYSPVWKFQTEEIPQKELANPVLISPGLGEKIQQAEVKLNWNVVEQANHYKVYLSSDKDFLENVMEYDNLLDTVLEVTGLKLDKVYYWKVEAGSTHERRLSEVWDFKTESPKMEEDLRQEEAPLTVSMFPNPSRDILNLELGNVSDDWINVTLSELNGNTVYSKKLENHGGLTTLNISAIKPGIYVVSILANKQSKVMRLIKK
ncbi:MAG: LamG-like jellyroll fold domain-containing protein, partial [Cyclobacteriaceae bacterium]